MHSYYTSSSDVTGQSVFHETVGAVQYETNRVSDSEGRDNGAWWSKTASGVTTDTRSEIYYDDLGRVSGGSLYTAERDTDGAPSVRYTTELLHTDIGYYNATDYTTGERVRKIDMYNSAGYSGSYTYDYDGSGRITQANGIRYTYDGAGQLVRVDDPDNGTTVYTYNAGGNIVSVTTHGYTTDTPGTAVTTKTYTYDTAWTDKLISVTGGSNTILYNADGTPRRYYNGRSMSWTNGRLGIILDSSMRAYYTYGEDGLRLSKKNKSGVMTEFTYADGLLTAQSNGTDSLYFRYTSDGAPVAFEYNGTEYYYVRNLQGDITAILDGSGTCVTEYTYDAWGAPLSVTGTLAATVGAVNPLRYRGYYYDTESGFYYLQSRYYDPEIGRFINADVMMDTESILGFNLFAYCENNPIMFVDPTG